MRIYDQKESFDRYTAIWAEKIRGLSGFSILGGSANPYTGIGTSDWDEVAPDRPTSKHLGKRISLSALPDEFKKYVCSYMLLPNFRLPKLSTKYGAQMGRSNTAKGKCKLGKVRLYDGYDNGGAYWGSPSDLYCAKSKTALATGYFDDPAKPGFSFVRANSPYEALKEFESMGLVF